VISKFISIFEILYRAVYAYSGSTLNNRELYFVNKKQAFLSIGDQGSLLFARGFHRQPDCGPESRLPGIFFIHSHFHSP